MISQSEKTNPISEGPKMNENLFATKVYDNINTFGLEQNKAKTNPISKSIKCCCILTTMPDPCRVLHNPITTTAAMSGVKL